MNKRRAHRWKAEMARNAVCEVERLVLDNWRLAIWFAGHHGHDLDREARMDCAMDGLLRAAQTFDPVKGLFSTHAVMQMRGFISHARTRKRAAKRGAEFAHVSLDEARLITVPFVLTEDLE